MTQRERILSMLEEAGTRGVHSFTLVAEHMPRGAAVICQLRKEGYEISSVSEPLNGNARGVRYRLNGSTGVLPPPDISSLFGRPSSRPMNPYESEAA